MSYGTYIYPPKDDKLFDHSMYKDKGVLIGEIDELEEIVTLSKRKIKMMVAMTIKDLYLGLPEIGNSMPKATDLIHALFSEEMDKIIESQKAINFKRHLLCNWEDEGWQEQHKKDYPEDQDLRDYMFFNHKCFGTMYELEDKFDEEKKMMDDAIGRVELMVAMDPSLFKEKDEFGNEIDIALTIDHKVDEEMDFIIEQIGITEDILIIKDHFEGKEEG